MPACSLGRHLNGIGSANFGGIRKISGDPVSSNAVRFRYVPGTSFDDPAGFGPKAHRPPSSILRRHARMLSGKAFARHGPWGLRGSRKVSDDPTSPDAVSCRHLEGASVDNPASFGPKAHRSRSSIFRHARMGPGDFGGTRDISSDI